MVEKTPNQAQKAKRSKPTKASQTSFTKSTHGPQQRWYLDMTLAF